MKEGKTAKPKASDKDEKAVEASDTQATMETLSETQVEDSEETPQDEPSNESQVETQVDTQVDVEAQVAQEVGVRLFGVWRYDLLNSNNRMALTTRWLLNGQHHLPQWRLLHNFRILVVVLYMMHNLFWIHRNTSKSFSRCPCRKNP